MTAVRTSHFATITRLTAVVVWFAAIAYVIVSEPENVEAYRNSFAWLRTLAYIGVGATLVCAAAAVFGRHVGISRPIAALAMVLFAVPVAAMMANEDTPPAGAPINDITTDLDDPPAFSAVIPLRPPGSNPIEYGGPSIAARQREAYPNVGPLISNLEFAAAFQKAFETAEGLGWEIVSGDLQSGIIEAVDTTRFFRFRDDVVIRIREHDGGTRIDLRSRSRIGRSDLGKNASRILTFIEEFNRS